MYQPSGEVGCLETMVPADTTWKPQTEAEKLAVREQLERLLAHPAFKSSKRCPSFLRFVVENDLQADSEHLKERTLGVKVFGRDPHYDTNLDPIIRSTASEVRKRIAQYYHEPGHESELRIDLPSGSYAPQFHPPFELASEDARSSEQPAIVTVVMPVAGRLRAPYFVIAAVIVVAAAASAFIGVKPRSALDQFWAPVFASSDPILVSVGQPKSLVEQAAPDNSPVSLHDHIRNMDHLVMSDAITMSRLFNFFGRRGKDAILKGAWASTLTDLRQGPSILVAGFDNPWTLRLTNDLRFHFDTTPYRKRRIEDRKDPSRWDWSVDFSQPYSQLTQDYAIVARFRDTTTRQVTVVAAGLGENGTITAGEFVTSAAFLDELAKQAPKGWSERNVEVVLATQVIDRKSGPPRILASYVW